jgi:hypothetical protein
MAQAQTDCRVGTPPDIQVSLSLNKPEYQMGEAITAKMSLANRGGEAIVPTDFPDTDFFLLLRFEDGRGNVYLSDNISSETARTPPSPPVFPAEDPNDDAKILLLQGDLVARLAAGWYVNYTPFDALEYYPLEGITGRFTAQAVIAGRTYDPEGIRQTTVGSELIEYAQLYPQDATLWCGYLLSKPVAFTIAGDADGDSVPFPEDCDDTDPLVYPGAAEIPNDGIDNDCDPATADIPVPPTVEPGFIQVQADLHTVGAGSKPSSTKSGIKVYLRVYDKSTGSCMAGYGASWQNYPSVWGSCKSWAAAGVTDASTGSTEIKVRPGNYALIGLYDPDDSIELFDQFSDDEVYIGRSVGDIESGQTVDKYLQVIKKVTGKKVPGKYTKRTGSELWIIEPEYVEWDGEEEYYPFIFESVGDWEVATSVMPPEGFVADHDSLAEEVTSEIEAVQFKITDIGSDWVATEVMHEIKHKGKKEKIKSKVGVKLSKKLAKEKGLDAYGRKMGKSKKLKAKK